MDRDAIEALWAKLPLGDAVLQVFRYVGDDARLQAVFDKERGRCYDDVIGFPNLVSLIGDALLEYGGSGNQSFSRAKESGELTASKVAVYGKLSRLPLSLSQAFLTDLSRPLRELFPVRPAPTAGQPAWFQHDPVGRQGDQERGQASEIVAESGRRLSGRPGTGCSAL